VNLPRLAIRMPQNPRAHRCPTGSESVCHGPKFCFHKDIECKSTIANPCASVTFSAAAPWRAMASRARNPFVAHCGQVRARVGTALPRNRRSRQRESPFFARSDVAPWRSPLTRGASCSVKAHRRLTRPPTLLPRQRPPFGGASRAPVAVLSQEDRSSLRELRHATC
jgi:hypothetical protein